MNRLYRLTILIVSAGMLLFLAACGQNSTGNGSSSSQPGLTGTSGTAQLVKTGIVPTKVPLHPSPTPTAPAQLTGKVILQIDTIPQQASASMVLTLNNSTNQEILFSDHLTECSVLLLQVQPQLPANSGTWQAVAPCKLMIVTRLHSLTSGKTLTITLIPPGGQWAPGLYHALLSYIPGGVDHKLQTVFSPSFQVGS
jgi:hypothetical protein